MEPISFLGGIIVLAGGIWTALDLLQDAGLLTETRRRKVKIAAVQAYSGFKSRDISSNTACRAGLLP